MIETKEAIYNAIDYANDILNKSKDNLRVEEVDITDDEKYWILNFGY
ncbi:MAG: hypothetical protein LBT10_02060 [Methanobrevibacter sp.]|jgi:hypothetical protein|nr:hypothetical protein [Methanobrevibacter sp.]